MDLLLQLLDGIVDALGAGAQIETAKSLKLLIPVAVRKEKVNLSPVLECGMPGCFFVFQELCERLKCQVPLLPQPALKVKKLT